MNKKLRKKFLKLYANLPMGIRSDIIAVIHDEPMSWSVCYLEIKQKTEFSKEILTYLDKMKFI